jgi:hypothetical protein
MIRVRFTGTKKLQLTQEKDRSDSNWHNKTKKIILKYSKNKVEKSKECISNQKSTGYLATSHPNDLTFFFKVIPMIQHIYLQKNIYIYILLASFIS